MEPTVGGALVSAATMPDVSGAPVRALQRGELLGRYVIMSRLGAGAMGVVYAAYSPIHNLVPRSRPEVRCFRPSRPPDQGF